MGSYFDICNDMGTTANIDCGNFQDQLKAGECTNRYKGSLSWSKVCSATGTHFSAWRRCYTGPTANSNHRYYIKKDFWGMKWFNKGTGRRMQDVYDMDDMDLPVQPEDVDSMEEDNMPKFLKSKKRTCRVVQWMVGLADEDTGSSECEADINEVLPCLYKCFGKKTKKCPEKCEDASVMAPTVKCALEKYAAKGKEDKMAKIDECLDSCKACEDGTDCDECMSCKGVLKKAAKTLLKEGRAMKRMKRIKKRKMKRAARKAKRKAKKMKKAIKDMD